jgi:hypothetical protein
MLVAARTARAGGFLSLIVNGKTSSYYIQQLCQLQLDSILEFKVLKTRK